MSDLEITGYQCKNCGRIHYPRHEQCLACQHRDFETVKPQGKAKLVAYTQIFNLPWGFDERFLIIGIGEFENGLKAMGQIKAESLDELKTGMLMDAEWETVKMKYGAPVCGLRFTPM
jgi:hypothetical protein